jgi:hypothetical protein
MNARLEPGSFSSETESELDATDGGWDPYVTSLLTGSAGQPASTTDDDDDGVPVMSFSRMPEPRRR